MNEPELLAYVGTVREIGYKVVMTNGVFDLLHAGHVRYLQAARELGHVLVVAVNDDESTRRLKPGRPINKLADRMAVLEALRHVDAVVAFGEDTPERLIGLIKPDVLVKGGDYKPEQIAGGDAVRAYGGKVLTVSFWEGYSTTGMLPRHPRRMFRPADDLERTAGPAAS